MPKEKEVCDENACSTKLEGQVETTKDHTENSERKLLKKNEETETEISFPVSKEDMSDKENAVDVFWTRVNERNKELTRRQVELNDKLREKVEEAKLRLHRAENVRSRLLDAIEEAERRVQETES